jgi:Chaperone of endosialidase
MLGKGGSQAPAADPAIGQAALMQAQLGKEWLGFSKDSFAISQTRQAELDKTTKEVSDLQIGLGKQSLDQARQDRERYNTVFKPIEDKFVKDASEYGSAANQDAAAATARADVIGAVEGQKQIAERQAAGLGIDPSSGRYAGIDRSLGLDGALAAAGAENNARTMTRDKGLALSADVVNLGRGVPAMSAQAAATGLNAGNSGIGLIQNANGQFMASTDIMGSGFRGGMTGYGNQANILNDQYRTQVSAWDAEQRNNNAQAAGIGKLFGGIAGLMFPSDENVKEDKKPIPDGQALDAVNAMPVEEWNYKPGIADDGRHVGTYAQDFQKQTGKGDGKSIMAQDAIGITMKAVQDLSKKVDKVAQAVGIGGVMEPRRKLAKSEPMRRAA